MCGLVQLLWYSIRLHGAGGIWSQNLQSEFLSSSSFGRVTARNDCSQSCKTKKPVARAHCELDMKKQLWFNEVTGGHSTKALMISRTSYALRPPQDRHRAIRFHSPKFPHPEDSLCEVEFPTAFSGTYLGLSCKSCAKRVATLQLFSAKNPNNVRVQPMKDHFESPFKQKSIQTDISSRMRCRKCLESSI